MGGMISWQFVSSNLTNNGTVTIELKQTYSWVNNVTICQLVTGRVVDRLICPIGCQLTTTNITTTGICINYDYMLDVTTSQALQSLTYSLGSAFLLAYRSSTMLRIVSGLPPWSLITYINLNIRNDSGQINSSPVTNMLPVKIVQVHTRQTIRIPMTDKDSDIVKCRWANKTALVATSITDECAGVCQNLAGAVIYSSSNLDNNCTIVFNTSVIGNFLIAIQIEDFMPSAPNGTALSSIPLQFVIRSVNIPCNIPVIMTEVLNDATISVRANATYSQELFAKADCNDTMIISFLTINLPSGMASVSSIVTYNDSVFSVTFTWTPNIDQVGTKHLFCTFAADSNSLQSNEYCLNIIVTPAIPSTGILVSTSTSNGESTNLYLLLGLLLGIGIPFCILLNILSYSLLPRWLDQTFLGELRRKFLLDEKEMLLTTQEKEYNDHVSNKNQTMSKDTELYREQYIQLDESIDSLTQSSKSTPNTSLPSESKSLAMMTRTSILSPVSTNITPINHASDFLNSSQQELQIRKEGSHLIRDYFKQNIHS